MGVRILSFLLGIKPTTAAVRTALLLPVALMPLDKILLL
ncbi:hypothetical protein J2S21_002632 [Peribacillus cavernae]|nr:hypothetical protein [Peribacillus cavernae]